MKFTVDRSRWARGVDGAALLNSKGMCCLGFLAKACGADDDMIEDQGDPSGASFGIEWPLTICKNGGNTQLTNRIIATNDCPSTRDVTREAELKQLFAEGGIEVEFVG